MGSKWKTPGDWLEDKIREWVGQENVQELALALRGLVTEVEQDNIQSVFQSDMEVDGYFDEDEN